MKSLRGAAACAGAALLLLSPRARARQSGYSVEAAAGVSSGGPSLSPTTDAHPYHPFRDFQGAPPPAGTPTSPLGAPSTQSAPSGRDDGLHPERNGVVPAAPIVNPAVSSSAAEEEKKPEEKPPETTLADAKDNFPAVVETFFRKAGEGGVWTLKESGTTRRFTLLSAEPRRLKGLGKGQFSGAALARDEATRRPTNVVFVVDLSGAEWKVVSAKVAASAPQR